MRQHPIPFAKHIYNTIIKPQSIIKDYFIAILWFVVDCMLVTPKHITEYQIQMVSFVGTSVAKSSQYYKKECEILGWPDVTRCTK